MTRHLFGGVWCSSSSAYALLRTLRDFQADAMVRDVVYVVSGRSKIPPTVGNIAKYNNFIRIQRNYGTNQYLKRNLLS